MARTKPTNCDETLHGLTAAQSAAVELVACGRADAEIAEAVGVHRVTVARWRAFSPAFQAAVNRRRQELFHGVADRLLASLAKAVDVAAAALDDDRPDVRLKAALGLLKLVPLRRDAGPLLADEIVNAETDRRRAAWPQRHDDALALHSGMPTLTEHRQTVRIELEAAAEGCNI